MAIILRNAKEFMGCGAIELIDEENNNLTRSITSIKVTPTETLPNVTFIVKAYQVVDGAWVEQGDETELHFTLTPVEDEGAGD